MDDTLLYAIFLLTGATTMPVQMPHTVKKTVKFFQPNAYADFPLTRNKTPIHGHEAGVLLLKTYIVRPSADAKTCQVEYTWDIAKGMGGIPAEKLFGTSDHNQLPGMNDESSTSGSVA